MRQKTVVVLLTALTVVASGCVTDFGPPTATFSGNACAYDGLPEFTPGDVVTFTLKNNSDAEAGLGIVKIRDGTSIDQLAADGIDPYLDGTVTPGIGTAMAGESSSFEFRFSIDGDWLVYCFSDMNYPAAVLPVSG